MHPVVRRHPGSGRNALYIASHASHIIDWPVGEGRKLLEELLAFATQPRFVYRHKWRLGDLVIWDNRCTLHRATPFESSTHVRDMRRSTVIDVRARSDGVRENSQEHQACPDLRDRGLLARPHRSLSAQTDDYPSRPITLLVPFPPGGSADMVIRPVAREGRRRAQAADRDRQPRGGGGNVAALATKQAAPDGYTLFLTNMGVMSVNPILSPELRFDPVKDFQPITPIISFPHILVVPPDSPVEDGRRAGGLAKTKPGGLSFGSQGVGSGGQILGEMFKSRRRRADGARAVPRRRSGRHRHHGRAASTSCSPPTSRSASRPRPASFASIAIGGKKRIDAEPDIPTMAEAGFPGLDLDMWHGMVAPAGTPAPIVKRLNEEFIKATRDPDILRIVAPQATDVLRHHRRRNSAS